MKSNFITQYILRIITDNPFLHPCFPLQQVIPTFTGLGDRPIAPLDKQQKREDDEG